MSRIPHLLASIVAVAVLVGCSDDVEKTKDAAVVDMAFHDLAAGDGAAACGSGIYPCGPYGVQVGDVAANLAFMGFSDDDNQCTDHKDKVMDLSKARQIAFADWHVGDASCAAKKKDLLWVMVSAGWCVPCQAEVQSTQKEFGAGAVDARLGILNIVFETKSHGEPADTNFVKTWINTFKLTFPVVADPSFKMGAYFNKKATPFNMLVETKTGKVYYRQVGGAISVVGQKITEFFSKK
jgi:hypothetical protein